jgi:RHS repeat-associated protein
MPEQGLLATYSESDVKDEAKQAGWYRIGVPTENRTYELTGLSTTRSALLSFEEVRTAANTAASIAYEAVPNGTLQKRLVEQVRHLYWDSSTLVGPSPAPLPQGTIDALALPYETYALAFTPGLLTKAYGMRVTSALLTEGGYVAQDGAYWVRTGREVLDPAKFYLPVQVMDPFGNASAIFYDDHTLLVTSVADPVNNTVSAEHDYRVLGPVLVTDPNGNRSAVKLDELGMVVASAVMGKVGSSDGDTLEDPTTTFAYDLDRFRTTGKPNVVHAAAREQHGDPATPWQHSYTYLDGLGREILKKAQAEPGPAPVRDPAGGLAHDAQGNVVLAPASPRWVGTGRVVFDNKGNPVKQYEPFFTTTHEYEEEQELVEWGVTPILRYDPLGRLIRTDLPDGTCSRVEFTPWLQASWDGNDTVLDAGNAWYAARQASATPVPSAAEQRAASLAAAHAGTPAVVHFDVLGRPVMGVEDNGAAGKYETRATLDIEGNPRTIIDARKNTAMEYVFDLLGRTLSQKSCDSGERWTFANVLGSPIRGWDGRGHTVRSVYDEVHRRTELWVQTDADPEVLAEKTVYGEGQSNPEAANLRGKVYQVKDGAGVVTSIAYDFKGNLRESQRQLAQEYKTQLDWSGSVALEAEVFTQTTTYDALNRPTRLKTHHDQSEVKPTYNEASLLEKVEVRVRGAATWTTFVDDIDYDAKGQREKIVYGNGVSTEYSYDPLTYRLTRIKTTRSSDQALLQDLRYTYDPVGNIVEMADLAQSDIYYNNDLVEPRWKYTYDALYRLIEATGREHAGQNADIQQDQNGFPLINAPNPNDPQALRNYTESYEYDDVGNIEKMIHDVVGLSGSWTRRYDVRLENNRLRGTSVPGNAPGVFSAQYPHDAHGNMTSMPHLQNLGWDFKDQMREVDLDGGGEVYFTYDAGGQRVRKVWEHSGIVEERIYLGGFEVYRRHELGAVVLERETLHVMDDARRIAMVETKTVDASDPSLVVVSRVRYQLGNHLGSATLELDEDGLVISYEEYHPYGTTAYHAMASGVEVSAKRYRYTGKERDEETGLYYHGARYYAPWLGRWTSADPAGLVDGPDLYVYGRANPVRLMDPRGTQAAAGPHIVKVSERPAWVDPTWTWWARPAEGVSIKSWDDAVEWSSKTGGVLSVLDSTAAPSPSAPTSGTPAASAPSSPTSGAPVASAPSPTSGAPASAFVEGAAGLAYGTAQAFTPGGFLAPSPHPSSRVFEFFRGVGQTVTGLAQTYTGLSMIAGGGGAAAAGIVATPASGGASLLISALGGSAIVAGIAAVAQGLSNIAAGIGTLSHAVSMSGGGGGSSTPPPSPPGGGGGRAPGKRPTTAPQQTAPAPKPQMFGARGPRIMSKTVWNRGRARIDMENPNPGQRPGQIHFQEGNNKYLYDPSTGKFTGAPGSVNDLLQREDVKNAIDKAMQFLGEKQ